MQIDSVKFHEELNKIAFDSSFDDLKVINKLRRTLCDLEAMTACERAIIKCKHVADGICHTSNPEKRMCIKCKNFY